MSTPRRFTSSRWRLRGLAWAVRYALQRWGRMRAVGALLLLGAAAFCIGVLLPLQQEVVHARQRLAQSPVAPMASHDKSPSTGEAGPVTAQRASQLGQFYASFPGNDQLTRILGEIYDAAPKRNLALQQGQYQLASASEQGAKDPLQHFEIVFPVKGAYQDIRGFVGDVLLDQRALALDGVSFSRENNMSAAVDAELHFTLYLREGT